MVAAFPACGHPENANGVSFASVRMFFEVSGYDNLSFSALPAWSPSRNDYVTAEIPYGTLLALSDGHGCDPCATKAASPPLRFDCFGEF
jgi:hypothetical protein